MDLKKAAGLGLVFWAVMFGIMYNLFPWYEKISWMKITVAIFAFILSYSFSQYIRLGNYSDALLFGVIVVAICIALDVAVTSSFNPLIFTYWQHWLGYSLVLFAPSVRLIRR